MGSEREAKEEARANDLANLPINSSLPHRSSHSVSCRAASEQVCLNPGQRAVEPAAAAVPMSSKLREHKASQGAHREAHCLSGWVFSSPGTQQWRTKMAMSFRLDRFGDHLPHVWGFPAAQSNSENPSPLQGTLNHLSHNKNSVFAWSTGNHASRTKKADVSSYLWLGLSLTNLHLPGF